MQSGIPDDARRPSAELLGRGVAQELVRLTGQSSTLRQRTVRETRIAAALHHPHIVSIFEGRPASVMASVRQRWRVHESGRHRPR